MNSCGRAHPEHKISRSQTLRSEKQIKTRKVNKMKVQTHVHFISVICEYGILSYKEKTSYLDLSYDINVENNL